MEHGAVNDPTQATFTFVDEDHTLANAVRFCLNQDPRVSFAGYSIPHPSDPQVNIRIQTTGDPAREILKDSCQNLMLMCQHVRSTVDNAVAEFRANHPADMETKTQARIPVKVQMVKARGRMELFEIVVPNEA